MVRRGRSDEGSALIMVLALLVILSLALGSMFANAAANLTTSSVVATQEKRFYAADGGVEILIQQMRVAGAVCSHTPMTINGQNVNFSCTAQQAPTYVITATTASGSSTAKVTIDGTPEHGVSVQSWVTVKQ